MQNRTTNLQTGLYELIFRGGLLVPSVFREGLTKGQHKKGCEVTKD